MSHQLLPYFHGRSGLVQPRTVRVAERVPAHRFHSKLDSERLDVPLLDLCCVVRTARHWIGEYSSLFRGRTVLTPVEEFLQQ